MFSQASVCPQWGDVQPLGRHTSPEQTHTPLWADTPWADTPPFRADTP